MMETIPRPLLVLTAIIVLVAVSVGIKDYMRGKEATPEAYTSDAFRLDGTSIPKSSNSAKTKQARMSVTKANARQAEQADQLNADTGKPIVSKEFLKKSASIVQPITAQLEGPDLNTRNEHNKKTAKPTFSVPDCVPLPNGTAAADADAPYYENWAAEYSCVFRKPGKQ